MFLPLLQKMFGRKNQPSPRRQPVRFRPQLEYLETRTLPSATTWYVNAADASAPVQNGTAANPFGTITEGVTAASNGDTVQVAAGTYNELVTVTKSITIDGAQSGKNPLTRSGPESIVSNPTGDFQIEADNVTIDGFTLQGVTSDPTSNPASLGAAIWTNPGFSGTHGGLQALYNIIQGNIAGIELDNDGTYQTKVQDNLFQNNNQPGANSGLDIETDFGLSNALIDSNKFTNTSFVTNSSALGIEAPSDHVTFSNNTVTNHGSGVFFFDTSNVTVTGNTFTGTSQFAIGALGGVNIMSIQNNTIQNGGTALFVEDDLGTPGSPDPNSNIQANFNNIGAKTIGVDISPNGSSTDAYTGTLDATNNYWGSASGPTSPRNPGGTGSTIIDSNDQVNFTPWLIAPPGSSSTLFWKDSGGDILTVDKATGDWTFFFASGKTISGTHAIVADGILLLGNGKLVGIGLVKKEIFVAVEGENHILDLYPYNPPPV